MGRSTYPAPALCRTGPPAGQAKIFLAKRSRVIVERVTSRHYERAVGRMIPATLRVCMNAEAQTTRRLAAILAADVVGYSRLMGVDEEGTLAALKAHRRELIDPLIAQHQGRIFKTTGDGLFM